MDSKFVIGLDYGSDSARAIVVNALTGETLATAVQRPVLQSCHQSIPPASARLYRRARRHCKGSPCTMSGGYCRTSSRYCFRHYRKYSRPDRCQWNPTCPVARIFRKPECHVHSLERPHRHSGSRRDKQSLQRMGHRLFSL